MSARGWLSARGRLRAETAAQLFGVGSFAVAQPLLDTLARHATFLVAHRVDPPEIAALVAGLLIVPTLLAWLVV